MKIYVKGFVVLISCFTLLGSNVVSQTIIKNKGKYGIIDDVTGEIVLQPIYEVVKYYPYRLENFLLIRQNYKYAYAYKVTYSYEQKVKKLVTPYWIISDFEYDAIDPLFNFYRKSVTELIMKYKKDGMYGLIHIESRAESKSMAFTEIYHHSLGKHTVFPPIYNQIFFNDNSIFPVQKNDKFGFVFAQKSDCADSFYVNNTEIKYNKIPRHISYKRDERTYTISVNENQKYGLLKFDYYSCKPKYQIPCECKTKIKQLYLPNLFVCEKTEANTMIMYNETDNQRFELPAIEKEEVMFETINTKNGNQYILIYNTNYKKENREIDRLERIENIYIVDIKNKKIKMSFLGNENVSYEDYTIKNMPLIMRQTKTNSGFSYDFFDIETENILFSIPPAKKGFHYNFELDFNCNTVRVLYYKTGVKLKKKTGCYDFETKTYKKGKCKKCD